jgi:DNA invertase Pin-like site-specific DNA recombinase
VAKGTGQVVIVPSLAVLGAGLDGLVAFVGKLVAAKIDLVLVDDGIDSANQEGSAWLAAVASLTGYQQALRRQKARAGQLRAKAAGVKFGRKPIPDSTMAMVRAALLRNEGVRSTGRRYQISPSRVAMEKKAMIADRGAAQ